MNFEKLLRHFFFFPNHRFNTLPHFVRYVLSRFSVIPSLFPFFFRKCARLHEPSRKGRIFKINPFDCTWELDYFFFPARSIGDVACFGLRTLMFFKILIEFQRLILCNGAKAEMGLNSCAKGTKGEEDFPFL